MSDKSCVQENTWEKRHPRVDIGIHIDRTAAHPRAVRQGQGQFLVAVHQHPPGNGRREPVVHMGRRGTFAAPRQSRHQVHSLHAGQATG
jgi:hypothetical protein